MGSIFGGRGGAALMGVGQSLLLWFVLPAFPAVRPSAPFPDEFPLFPTMGNEGASGMAYLKQPWSPYGVSVDEDGQVQYDLTIHVKDLQRVEGEVYRVWVTTPTLDPIVGIGEIDPTGKLNSTTDWNQLMVIVSREPADRVVAEGERWSGPVVLRGFSAGARVTPLAQHSLFQQTPM
jgi:hypothetical protein